MEIKGISKDRLAEIAEDGLEAVTGRVERYIEDVRAGATELTSPEAKREFTRMTRELVVLKHLMSIRRSRGHDAGTSQKDR